MTQNRRQEVPDCYEIYGSEEAAMMAHTTVQALGFVASRASTWYLHGPAAGPPGHKQISRPRTRPNVVKPGFTWFGVGGDGVWSAARPPSVGGGYHGPFGIKNLFRRTDRGFGGGRELAATRGLLG